jgi:hypothetical protein|tara:strand:+ start:341 stop:658 length:318 start_codon:yes stop_codon:yes gene_type:complete
MITSKLRSLTLKQLRHSRPSMIASSYLDSLRKLIHRGTTRMDKLIKIEVKNSYGSERYYPKCNLSKMFCDIAGTQTITQDIISTIRRNGYNIDDVTPKKTFETNQ